MKPAKNQSGCSQSWGKTLAKLGPMLRKKSKEIQLSISFFHILHGQYLLKQKVVVVQILKWKFKANVAGNPTFEGQ